MNMYEQFEDFVENLCLLDDKGILSMCGSLRPCEKDKVLRKTILRERVDITNLLIKKCKGFEMEENYDVFFYAVDVDIKEGKRNRTGLLLDLLGEMEDCYKGECLMLAVMIRNENSIELLLDRFNDRIAHTYKFHALTRAVESKLSYDTQAMLARSLPEGYKYTPVF